MKVRLITKSIGAHGTEYEGKTLDEIIVGIARVSSSRSVNELFDEPYKLIRHCISNGHWSVFTMVNLGFEIETSRAIGREYLRHKSSNFQEFSQRYSDNIEFEPIELRKQSESNRQSSTDIFDPMLFDDSNFASNYYDCAIHSLLGLYLEAITNGIARETARMILPECTKTTIVMNATVREWITTLNQRLHKTAQKEARLVAEAIRDEFIKQLPLVSKALFNFEDAYDIPILDRVVLEKYKVYKQVREQNK